MIFISLTDTPNFFVSHKFGQHLVQQLFLWEDEADEEEISKKGDDANHQDDQPNFGVHLAGWSWRHEKGNCRTLNLILNVVFPRVAGVVKEKNCRQIWGLIILCMKCHVCKTTFIRKYINQTFYLVFPWKCLSGICEGWFATKKIVHSWKGSVLGYSELSWVKKNVWSPFFLGNLKFSMRLFSCSFYLRPFSFCISILVTFTSTLLHRTLLRIGLLHESQLWIRLNFLLCRSW